MAHGENANKWHRGREYWSRRAGVQSWGPIGKQITHEKERMQAKEITAAEIVAHEKEKSSKQEGGV